MWTKVILAVMLDVTIDGSQVCCEAAGAYASRSTYQYGQSGYQYRQPPYSSQPYGEYRQYPSSEYAQGPRNPRHGYGTFRQYSRCGQDGQYGGQHTVCYFSDNNFPVCDAEHDRRRRLLPTGEFGHTRS